MRNITIVALLWACLVLTQDSFSSTSESEPNNGYNDSGTITISELGAYTGQVSSEDPVDYWKIGFPSEGELIITATATLYLKLCISTGDYSTEGLDLELAPEGEIALTLQNDKRYGIIIQESSGNYSFTLSGDAVLPIKLVSFQAFYEKMTGITLNWKTESKVGAVGFIIDRRSSNESAYHQLTSYRTDSTLVCLRHQIGYAEYSYTDKEVIPGVTYSYCLSDVDIQGNISILQEITVEATSVAEKEHVVLPELMKLYPAYPNPFNPHTQIQYFLAHEAVVFLTVYNLAGQQVRQLIDNVAQSPGVYLVSWDGTNDAQANMPSGMYIITLKTHSWKQSQKVNLVR